MSFLARLALVQPFETWPVMVLAAEQRYWDGLTLALADSANETSALYLLGYAAEMLLKTAYFQAVGVPPGDDIASYLRTAQRDTRWRGGNLHNLKSWFYLLNDVRYFQGNPWNPLLASTIERHVMTVDAHWRETLRYTPLVANAVELEETLASVDWLLVHYDFLWR